MKEIITGFYGYHGTTASAARTIFHTREFDPGEGREDHWLGQGSYFFREDGESARVWAVTKIRQKQLIGEEPFVVGVKIDVTNENFLNLDSRTGFEKFRQHLQRLKNSGMKIKIPKGDDDIELMAAKVRCLIMSLIPEDIWVIQRTFKVPRSYFNRINEFKIMQLHLNGTQVCVRDNRAILKESIYILYPETHDLIGAGSA